MFGLGALELIVMLVLIMMLFGAGKLSDVFGAFGKGISELRKQASVDNKKVATAIKTNSPSTKSAKSN